MAKIVLSDTAPEGAKKFSLASAEIEVPFETNDNEILSNARQHPWLSVEEPKASTEAPPSYVNHLDPKDDALSALNSIANDPDEVKKALEAREDRTVARVALNADLDQQKKVETGGVAETVAAADAAEAEVEKVPASTTTKKGGK